MTDYAAKQSMEVEAALEKGMEEKAEGVGWRFIRRLRFTLLIKYEHLAIAALVSACGRLPRLRSSRIYV